jgi:hypothetical protein
MSQRELLLEHIESNILPSGSGIDNGCKIDLENHTAERFTIRFGYHHMDEHGYYCGWTDYRAVIRADLAYGYRIDVYGKDVNGIKDYLAELFVTVMEQELDCHKIYRPTDPAAHA